MLRRFVFVLAVLVLFIGAPLFFLLPLDPKPLASIVAVENLTTDKTLVYIAFGAGSAVGPDDFKAFCEKTSPLNCQFSLDKRTHKRLPTEGRHLNATFSFGAPVACGATKAEIDVNNPNWYDTLDVSLVDGYSNKVSISILAAAPDAGVVVLGPPLGKDGNEKVLGLFPFGCDICTARQNPPCGISKGTEGCKSGTQYKPDVICQYQGRAIGGGESVLIRYHGE